MSMTTENSLTIRTNNVRRPILRPWELTMDELKEFDYLVDDATSEEQWMNSGAEFFRFRGQLYDLGEFSRVISPDALRCHPMECAEPAFQGWDGYTSDSFFSGMLVKWPRDEFGIDTDSIIVGTYCC